MARKKQMMSNSNRESCWNSKSQLKNLREDKLDSTLIIGILCPGYYISIVLLFKLTDDTLSCQSLISIEQIRDHP